jgi:hypothetical protein
MTQNAGGQPAREPVRPGREPGNAPGGEPGNAWVTPEAERPPRRESTVSDPDLYPAEPDSHQPVRLRPEGVGTVSNPDF